MGRIHRLHLDYREMRRDCDSVGEAAWWTLRGVVSAAWDDSRLARRWWDVRHPPIEMWWDPQISLHLRRWNPVFWLVLVFGEV